MTERVHLAGTQGSDPRPVNELLAPLLDARPLVWCEPVPRAERVRWFVGLWAAPATGLRALLSQVPIEEARLFWPGGWLHLRRLGDRTFFAWLWEGKPAERPGMIQGAFGPLEAEGLPGTYERVYQEVLSLRDFRRYGLAVADTEWPRDLTAVEYRQGTRVAFWRLEERQ